MTSEDTMPRIPFFLLGFASLIIIIAGVKLAEDFILPLLLAVFISILTMPLLFWFKRKKVNNAVSLLLILGLLALIFSVFGTIVAVSTADLLDNIPFYEAQLKSKLGLFYSEVQTLGILDAVNFQDLINPSSAFQYISVGIAQIGSVLAQSLLILIVVAFMLVEASRVYTKCHEQGNKKLETALSFIHKVNQYMAIKAIVSLFTGLCVTIFLSLVGIHYPVLWGLLAFVLNFVPNIGSIMAAIPVILLAIIQYGIYMGLIVFLAYLAVNFIFGNVIEPRYLGKQLGLSPLVVILSLIFWGWIFGPIGMLLAVPLTIVVKFALESVESTKWIAMMMEGE